jgi:hypothetical protein
LLIITLCTVLDRCPNDGDTPLTVLLPVFTTCVLLHDMVFWVLMAVPCTMVCYLVGMLFTHVHKKKEMKKKEIVCTYYFHI